MDKDDFSILQCFQVSLALDNPRFLKEKLSKEDLIKLETMNIKEQTQYINSIPTLQRSCRMDYELRNLA